MWIAFAIGAVVVAALGGLVASRMRHYSRMFSVESFREYHAALSRAVQAARSKPAEAEPRIEEGTAFLTQAGLAVAVSWRTDEDHPLLHISFSQPGGYTTHAVCSHFGFFTLAMLASNRAELTPFFTASGVHHLVFRLQSPEVTIRDFDAVDAAYRTDYRPIPFQLQTPGAG